MSARARFYTCPRCERLLVTALDGKEPAHECANPSDFPLAAWEIQALTQDYDD